MSLYLHNTTLNAVTPTAKLCNAHRWHLKFKKKMQTKIEMFIIYHAERVVDTLMHI